MTFHKEFKEALSHLSSVEKDKLILRLLKKDLMLANRLAFELLDNGSVDDRRADLEIALKNEIEYRATFVTTPGYLMMDLRDMSGRITEHLKITKDKFGEVSLNLLMLVECLKIHNKKIEEYTPGKSRKLSVYIIARAFKILILICKMHEDTFMEFEDDLKKLGTLISDNKYLMRAATFNRFDVNWLLNADIPEDIEAFHKEIRANGYLKSNSF
ncbi:hypothetical protein [uncultured Nonlabens sp.]|uniref:hypothetical protein n=1 Tax=uncultured Nonlabens sp. TaxID=859306 RepID=UPI0026129C07|nr:hypothetical protein [uncultured Nonlabens sp.]